jgi:hypothetical protein
LLGGERDRAAGGLLFRTGREKALGSSDIRIEHDFRDLGEQRIAGLVGYLNACSFSHPDIA